MYIDTLLAFLSKQADTLVGHSLSCIDGRKLVPGQVFFALKGNQVDGFDYVHQAVASGASAVVVDRAIDLGELPVFVVPDVLIALQDVARAWRASLDLPVVGLTGSCGKTTTRFFIQTLLQQLSSDVWATKGNYNNHIGVPLSILGMRSHHKVAVFEMGASHPGEIQFLTEMVQPHVGLLTNAKPSHLDGFKNIEGVVKTKGELFATMKSGHAVLNKDDIYYKDWSLRADHLQAVSFGECSKNPTVGYSNWSSQECGSSFDLHYNGKVYRAAIPLVGDHQQKNVCAAVSVCLALGYSIELIMPLLHELRGFAGRLEFKKTTNGIHIIDDTYNANPASYQIALKALAEYPAVRKWVVFGDMGELSEQSNVFHDELVANIAAMSLSGVVGMGPQVMQAVAKQGCDMYASDNQGEVLEYLRAQLQPGDVVLVKGSRFMKMDQIVLGL